MFEEVFAGGVLNLIYIIIVLVSFVFAMLSLLGAEIGDLIDFDFDTDSDFDFVSISPFALAMFGASFGLIGLVTRIVYEMEPLPSLLWATVAGLLIAILAQAFFIYVLSPSRSSHFTLAEDALGREAQVITTIPPEGIGEVVYNNVSGRIKLGARSAPGKTIHIGDVVIVEKVVGRVAFVRPLDEAGK